MEPKKHTVGEISLEVLEYTPDTVEHENPILLVHGSWGGAWMWKSYIEFLVENGWKVYALSLRGHGGSGGEVAGATMDDYRDDIKTVVRELNISSPYIVGHSMGGLLVLMYSKGEPVRATVSINPSPSLEIVGEGREAEYPLEYTPVEAGMPTEPDEVVKTFPDIPMEILGSMKKMLGKESGVARSQRKKGISIKKDEITKPLLFVGSDLAGSVPFGIGIEKTKQMADYYEADFVEIKNATHPGILIGKNALEGAKAVHNWLSEIDAGN